jgi:tetratricopeptide (TPR) repeat protein
MSHVLAAARVREKAGIVLRTAGHYDQALTVLQQAAESYQAAEDMEGLGRVLGYIGQAHMCRDTAAEPLERLEQMLAVLEQRGAWQGVTAVCVALASLYDHAGRLDEQLAVTERAVDMARALGDERLLANAQECYAWALVCMGRAEEALPVLEETMCLAEALGDLPTLCYALQTAAEVYADRGEVEKQRVYSDRAVASAERLGDPMMRVVITAIRGVLAFFHGNWARTRADCEQALAVSRQTGSWLPVPPLLYLGQLCLAQGEWHEAAQHLEEAALMAVHIRRDAAAAQTLLAHLDLLAGRPAAANARLALLSEQPGPREGWEWQVTPLLVLLAWAHLELDAVAQAAAIVAQAVTRARATYTRRALVEALWMQAKVAIRQEHWAEARGALDEGVALARRICYPYGEARLLHAELEPARERLEAALAIFLRLGARKDVERVEQAIADLQRP